MGVSGGHQRAVQLGKRRQIGCVCRATQYEDQGTYPHMAQTVALIYCGTGGQKAELEKVIKDHINTVAGHFKGKIYAWDVVNEVIDDGSGKLRDSIFSRTFNSSFIEEAFRTAHAADPNAKLYINDYNVEAVNTKSDALYALVKEQAISLGVRNDRWNLNLK
ncbi:unnamed protein product, partial [Oppiella nova]